MKIINHGQIALLTLPDDWAEDLNVKRVDIGSRSSRKFRPAATKEVEVCLFYRGFPISAADAAAFVAVLEKAPHFLLSTEVKSIAVVLGQRAKSEAFSILSLRTEDLNGKRILVLEGRYKDPQNDIYEIFVNADGAGEVVQEIYLVAPKESYMIHLQKIKKALKSIKWKGSGQDRT